MPGVQSLVADGDDKHGVLDRAFMVLDVLSRVDDGLGLSELARNAGLAKTTTHRIAEQLVSVGAVQQVDQRYYIGPLAARLGRCWQPDPLLLQAAADPVRALVGPADAAAVYALHGGKGRLVTAAARGAHCWILPPDLTASFIPLAAAWHVLMVADRKPVTPVTRSYRLLMPLRDRGVAISVQHEGAPEMSCVAAPLPSDGAHRPAAVAVLTLAAQPAPWLMDLVLHTADRIMHRLR
ncbi:helix-turn-helix domain-containing protein [Nocardia lijiangensis]|uniref:helix-turn-helix domain-containing protein n=1 Tax=Nocardia lijiangensis TaxID=299618 RepID=UPI000831B553|nr:helix-turn-helix domain-containing protein [Nocardia lijiangensis]